MTGRDQELSSFSPEEFTFRRERVYEAIGDSAIAILQGASEVRGYVPFRQTNEFYYLSGIEVPHAYMLLDGRKRSTTLYLPHRDEHREAVEGRALSAENGEDVRRLNGIERVTGPESVARDIAWTLFHGSPPAVFTPLSPAEIGGATRDMLLIGSAQAASDPWDGELPREARFVQHLRRRFPQLEIQNLSPILDRLRLVKSSAEVTVMREAGRLCGLGVMEAIRSTYPGVMEYQLAAAADFHFRVGGAQGSGYRAIVASGPNIWNMHYHANNRAAEAGDLVLMDYAPDYRYYTSDIGRMWPVSGTYEPWQRELYGFIVEYHKRLLERIRPGATPSTILQEAADDMRTIIDQTSFSSPSFENAARETLQVTGHLSHPVGMAVHDVGDYTQDALAPGHVFSVDPTIVVPEERIYIRVEDTVAVTADGIENFTGFVPLDLDDVERLMRKPGLLQTDLALPAVAGT